MKRCPNCHSVSPDDETTCGVCGADIADAPFESMDEIDREQIQDARLEAQTERKAFGRVKERVFAVVAVELLVALVLIGIGLLLLFQSDLWGLLVLIIGFGLIGVAFGAGPIFAGRWRRR